MEPFAFPAELVDEIGALWAELAAAGTEVPPLPAKPMLRSLVEIAFWASLATEEGRPVRFALCCSPVASPVALDDDPAVEAWGFEQDRPYDVAELRRLAVATSHERSAIWVQFDEDGPALRIHGMINLGLSWAFTRLGLSDQPEPLPNAFLLRVEGPGTITVLLHQTPILGLYHGVIRRPRTVIGPRGGAFFQDGIAQLTAELPPQPAAVEAEARRLIHRTYFHVLRTIVNGIRDRGHGGALVLAGMASPALDPERAMVRPRYTTGDSGHRLAHYVVQSVEARLRLEHEGGAAAGLALRAASLRLVEAAEFVAGLAGTDGAIVMRADMSLVGFGAEIAVEPRVPAPIMEFPLDAEDAVRQVSAGRFGMRHRSALWLCANAPDVSAFVISQDGGVSFVFGQDHRVYMVPHLETLQFAAESYLDEAPREAAL